MKYFIYFLIPFFLVGCYTEKHDVKPTFAKENLKLDKSKAVYIAVPEDGQYENKVYKQSGYMTTEAIKTALATHIRLIKSGKEVEEYKVALDNAKQKNAEYLIYPVILQWVDRATEWSGKSDKITIKISVVDVNTKNDISSVMIKSNSSWWTFGGDHPQDLLEKPISQYIDSLYE